MASRTSSRLVTTAVTKHDPCSPRSPTEVTTDRALPTCGCSMRGGRVTGVCPTIAATPRTGFEESVDGGLAAELLARARRSAPLIRHILDQRRLSEWRSKLRRAVLRRTD